MSASAIKSATSRHIGLAAMLGALILLSADTATAGDPIRGKGLSAVCASCHGDNGDRSITPDIPVLAGQHYSYLLRTLIDYRSGARQNLIMASFVKDMSNQDMEDIAAWYAGQIPALHTPKR